MNINFYLYLTMEDTNSTGGDQATLMEVLLTVITCTFDGYADIIFMNNIRILVVLMNMKLYYLTLSDLAGDPSIP